MWKLIIISAYILLIICCTCSHVHGDPKVPCHFIFGDSVFDAGNNNALNTTAKANYAPYGVDFPGGLATGRFTNGLTISDLITELLGFEALIPPFTTASGNEILKGVNYASGAAGIRPEAGSHLGERIWLGRQVANHGTTISELQSFVNGPVNDYLNKCLYSISIGGNDYVNNYFLPQFYPTKNNISNHHDFTSALIDGYEQQLQDLYNYGARKTAIFGVGPAGCTPGVIRRNNANECDEEITEAVQLFNQKLVDLVDSLNDKLVGANFTLIHINAINDAMPPPLGLLSKDGYCCELLRSDYQCDPSTPLCLNRNLYLFMDGYHSTEVLNKFIATNSFNSPLPTFVHPVDINELVTT